MKMKLFCLAMIFFAIIGCNNLCSNNIVKTVYSPNKKYIAVAFIRDCGATTDFSSQVTLLKKSRKFKNTAGNVFIGNHSEFINILWRNDSTLVIIHDCSVLVHRES